LDGLHEKFAGCSTLAFADLSTQMILVANTASTLRREGLDALCAEASLTLGTDAAPAMGQQASTTAFIATKAELRIYLRAAAEPSDVLCCVCAPDLDVAAFLAEARPCLDRISHGG
jgi:hypothetical protein